MRFRQAILIADGQTYQLTPGKSNSFDSFFADFQSNPVVGEHIREEAMQYSVFLHPKQDLVLQRLEIQFDVSVPAGARFLANGYQSWSESRFLSLESSIPRLLGWFPRRTGVYGDDGLPDIPRGAGHLHSWTYTVLQENTPSVTFLGSLNESTGFTLFLYDRASGVLTVRKDLAGLHLAHSFPALDFVVLKSDEKNAYDAYFQLLGIQSSVAPPITGWSSGPAHAQALPESFLLKNLDSYAAFQAVISHPEYGRETGTPEKTEVYFMIDDGWQTATGDWLSVKPGFPRGLAPVSTAIREKQMAPGIWLAPFVASEQSELAQKHPDWLLKGPGNKPLKVGWKREWGGWFHALDFYNPAVQAHLAGVFHMIYEKWGFRLLKLDYLFAVCQAPPPGKTRGQVMYEAMQFLRQLAGRNRLWAGGVPLGAAFGQVDDCRVGGEVNHCWESVLPALLRYRERSGALASLRSVLHRWPLNGRAFGNDPGLFTLTKNKHGLNAMQQQTVLVINVLLGKSLLTSDDVSAWSAEQIAEYSEALALRDSQVESVSEVQNDLYLIRFQHHGEQYAAWCNLNRTSQQIPQMELRPFETIILSV